MSPESFRIFNRDPKAFLDYIDRHRKPCRCCGGKGAYTLMFFEQTCSHCEGSGAEPVVKEEPETGEHLDLSAIATRPSQLKGRVPAGTE